MLYLDLLHKFGIQLGSVPCIASTGEIFSKPELGVTKALLFIDCFDNLELDCGWLIVINDPYEGE